MYAQINLCRKTFMPAPHVFSKLKVVVAALVCALAHVLVLANPVKSGIGARSLLTAQAGDIPTYTCEDYIQDGLLCMWDGVENAGLGVHDDNALTWVDLTGNGFDLTVDPECGEWGRNCIVPYANCWCPAYRLNAEREFNALKRHPVTIEVVVMPQGGGGFVIIVGLSYSGGQYQKVCYNTNYNAVDYWVGKNYKNADASSIRYSTKPVTLSCSDIAVFANGVDLGTLYSKAGTGSWGTSGGAISIAGYQPRSGDAVTARAYAFTAPIYTIRVYDRELDAEERVYNHMIDKARFGL